MPEVSTSRRHFTN